MKTVKALPLVAIAAFAASIQWAVAFRGFMPLDGSIVFDSAKRILEGQIPFRDFFMPFGLTPTYIQLGFFHLFGVNIEAYRLHACVLNVLFALMSFDVARRWQVSDRGSFITGILAAIVFYPPIGLPFADQEGYFFLMLAIWLLALARDPGIDALPSIRESRKSLLLSGLAGLALTASFFSKQIPAVLFIPALVVAASAGGRRGVTRIIVLLGVFGLTLICSMALTRGSLFHQFYFDVPGELGRSRLALLQGSNLPRQLLRLVDGSRWHFVLLASLVSLLFLLSRWRRLDSGSKRDVVFVATLVLGTTAFCLLTANQPSNGVALMPLAFMLAIERAGRAGFPAMGKSGRYAFWVLTAISTGWFIAQVVYARGVNELRLWTLQASSLQAPEGWRPSLLRVPKVDTDAAANFSGFVEKIRAAPGDVWLVSTWSIAYHLAGKPSLGPFVFFHAGLTYPASGTEASEAAERIIAASLLQRTPVLVAARNSTQSVGGLQDFPEILACMHGSQQQAEIDYAGHRWWQLDRNQFQQCLRTMLLNPGN